MITILLALMLIVPPVMEAPPVVESVIETETRIIYQVMKPNEIVYRHPRANGELAIMVNDDNHPDATIESIDEFLLTDSTEDNEYIKGVYQCTDYAVDLHNNAEMAGFMAGVVHIDLSNNAGHAITVIATREGWMFIDNRGNTYTDITDTDFEIEGYSITW